jgi:Zn-dependent protease with chaperone function
MAVLTVLFVWIGSVLGGRQGAIIAFVVAGFMNFGGYWFSDKLVLRRYRAHEVGPEDSSGLYRIVSELAQNAQLPMHKVFVIPQPTPNAFATGRNPRHAAVAGGAKVSGEPLSPASALIKIHQGIKKHPLVRGNPAHSHLFIVNPFFGGLQRLFSAHPPVEERIRRLEALAMQMG